MVMGPGWFRRGGSEGRWVVIDDAFSASLGANTKMVMHMVVLIPLVHGILLYGFYSPNIIYDIASKNLIVGTISYPLFVHHYLYIPQFPSRFHQVSEYPL